MAKLVVEIETQDSGTDLVEQFVSNAVGGHNCCNRLSNLLDDMVSGGKNGVLNLKANAVQASLAGTFSGLPTAAETMTINGVNFTARASGASGNEFNIGADATATAANAAAAINASSTAGIVDVIVASAASGVLTVKSKQAGKVGNAIVVAESMSNFAWAGAATKLASGAQGSNSTLQFGLVPSSSY